MAHYDLGLLLLEKRQDVDGAEEAYHAGIEADPGYAPAHYSLGFVLENKRQDVDGAEALRPTARRLRRIRSMNRREVIFE